MADQISIRSGSIGFTISPTILSNGKVVAIRVQDVSLDKWFNWDNGVWDAVGEPVITPGAGNLYIAFWVVNQGATGNLEMNLKDSSGVLATKTFNVPAGEGLGVEWTGDMPTKNYVITVEVVPNDSKRFTIKPVGVEVPTIPWWEIILITLGFIGVGAGAAVWVKRTKKGRVRG